MRFHSGIRLEGLIKPRKTTLRISYHRAETSTWNLQHTKKGCKLLNRYFRSLPYYRSNSQEHQTCGSEAYDNILKLISDNRSQGLWTERLRNGRGSSADVKEWLGRVHQEQGQLPTAALLLTSTMYRHISDLTENTTCLH